MNNFFVSIYHINKQYMVSLCVSSCPQLGHYININKKRYKVVEIEWTVHSEDVGDYINNSLIIYVDNIY